jgi:hypothetical protein
MTFFGIYWEFQLSVFGVEPSSYFLVPPRGSSIKSFVYLHLLRVDKNEGGFKAHDVGLAITSFSLQWAVLLLAPRALLHDKAESVWSCATDSSLLALACPSTGGVQHISRLIVVPAVGLFGVIKNTDLIHECTGTCACIQEQNADRYIQICTDCVNAYSHV